MSNTGENKRKHLEFIQNVITRMNSNSFLIKGWAITLTSALFALAANDANKEYIIITYIGVPVFWGLDGYYLSLEKQYRSLYKDVVKKDESTIDYDMDASIYNKDENTWSSNLLSKSIWIAYSLIILTTFLMMILVENR